MASLPDLNVTLLDSTSAPTNLNAVRNNRLMVLDFWHTKCVKCPAALDKLNEAAEADPTQGDVVYVSCALSQGPGNRDLASDMIAGTWEHLTHVFMEADVKEEAKALLGFAAVPYVAVVGKDGVILGHGDPKSFDYMALVKAAPCPAAPGAFALDEDF